MDKEDSHYYCTECSNGFTLTLTSEDPDIADSYFSGDRALNGLIASTEHLTYIYTLALNRSCSGRSGAIMAIQYCYQRNADRMLSSLTLLSLTRSNGFTVDSIHRFMLPTDQPCTQPEPYCCQKFIATDPHFLIPPSERFIIFGVSLGTGVTPLAYLTSTPNNYAGIKVIQYDGQLSPGQTIRPTTRAERLLLLRFWIGNY